MRGAILHYTPLPQYVFMAWCLVTQRNNFTFTFIKGDYTHTQNRDSNDAIIKSFYVKYCKISNKFIQQAINNFIINL
jgi:hypothetical protein